MKWLHNLISINTNICIRLKGNQFGVELCSLARFSAWIQIRVNGLFESAFIVKKTYLLRLAKKWGLSVFGVAIKDRVADWPFWNTSLIDTIIPIISRNI